MITLSLLRNENNNKFAKSLFITFEVVALKYRDGALDSFHIIFFGPYLYFEEGK